VGQFYEATHKNLNRQGHEVSRSLLVSGVSFVYRSALSAAEGAFVVNGFAN